MKQSALVWHVNLQQRRFPQIAVVNQDPVLFSTSIRDNIAYGRPDCSLEQVQEAARQANAHGFISNLENGYETGKLLTLAEGAGQWADVWGADG